MLSRSFIFLLVFLGSVQQGSSQGCPKSIRILGPGSVDEKETLPFTANVEGYQGAITYNWTVSAGTIETGQGTSMIKVKTDGLAGMTVTATVEVLGLPKQCMNTYSFTSQIMERPVLVIAEKYTNAVQLGLSIERFIKQTDFNNPALDQIALIFVYPGPATSSQQLNQIKTQIKIAFDKNQVMEYQYMLKEGPRKKDAFYEIYKMKSAGTEPKPGN